MLFFSCAKINIGLAILGKRSDDYHDIETIMYPIPLFDMIEIVPSTNFSFTQSGLPIDKQGDNLCVKAYRLVKEKFDIPPVKIHLHKMIPIGAGLGGGSSNAITTIEIVNTIYKLGLKKEDFFHFANILGSDCSFFVDKKPVLASGRGNILHPIPINLKGTYLLLVCPPIHISSKTAYQNIPKIKDIKSSLQEEITAPLSSWRERIKNDFEEYTFKMYPQIRKIKKKMYDNTAIYSSMTGSGSTVFGIFEKEVKISFERTYKTLFFNL